MTTITSSSSSGLFAIVPVVGIFVGAMAIGYGLLVVPQSVLGGAWIAAFGLTLLFSGLIATQWVRDRFGLSPGTQRTLAVASAVLAAVLLVSFVGINFASFEAGVESSS